MKIAFENAICKISVMFLDLPITPASITQVTDSVSEEIRGHVSKPSSDDPSIQQNPFHLYLRE